MTRVPLAEHVLGNMIAAPPNAGTLAEAGAIIDAIQGDSCNENHPAILVGAQAARCGGAPSGTADLIVKSAAILLDRIDPLVPGATQSHAEAVGRAVARGATFSADDAIRAAASVVDSFGAA